MSPVRDFKWPIYVVYGWPRGEFTQRPNYPLVSYSPLVGQFSDGLALFYVVAALQVFEIIF